MAEQGKHSFKRRTAVDRRRLGFARVCVRVELGRPLIPGVRIDVPAGPYWQRYAYENLECLCPYCGSVLHLQGKCRGAGGSRMAAGSVESPEMVEHGEINFKYTS